MGETRLPVRIAGYRHRACVRRRAAQVSFYTAVDLALRNSTQVRISAADVRHAEAAVMESVDAYKPSFSVGSSLGYSYGFPVGQPSIYSVSANSLAFSFTQPSYIRAARAALLAAQLQLKDTRQQVILDTALDYIELTTGEPADDRTRSGNRLRSKTGGDRNGSCRCRAGQQS